MIVYLSLLSFLLQTLEQVKLHPGPYWDPPAPPPSDHVWTWCTGSSACHRYNNNTINIIMLTVWCSWNCWYHVFTNKPFLCVLLLALLRRRRGRRRRRALPLLGAAGLLVPPLVRCGHLVRQRLGGDPLPLGAALPHLVVLLVHPLVVLVQV